ncbi:MULTISPECIES: beta-ketoacyl-ACP synthase II [Stutzerimonas]|uniref:3-oxoacyl-[acyl-carrier-protein] synthase 2 n=3 Tax=Stutzerimonas stutzeri subgroup TaxID=578833 RepID=A0A2N8SEK7_9GAMM|nr:MULTISPECIES: beta-ketoacyl-ACP synthase II [Stutzerimonas stutzeri group]MBU0562833.1 beta-ketoacyl-ACP synthase II [Gammaproteobacteria bacterium]MCQ4293629.1 beta-ketoacyl-ACP synthase II [Stutzerimonas stutzeri]OCX95760.1 MAG: beta-ketoacyl-[acyl-carrier-protein] synthase II [Pseudomonas sp. K35]OHC14131.1 MAG: beta-ketoacyl-[acyl-carrier-protein] synthase II [Pseudomonadales bacterium GWC2_63_15]PKM03796.1 MAG: beta-ketoacyl-[acyl-carrier-protein] synthase II [Gammaproteobacteria bacte
MSRRRVVVTGMGMLSPLGNDVPSSWQGILAGRSGIGLIEHMDLSAYSTRFGGSIKSFDVEQYLPAKEARKLDLFIQYGLAASFQAVRDSGLEVTDANRERIGVAMGSGIGGLTNIENSCKALIEQGPRRISPFFVPGSIINMVSGFLSIHLGLQGPNYAIATACTTGTHCIGMAARNIAYGEADVMVAGGSEMAASGLGIGGFAAARALSTRNDDPAAASRPWDKGRDGFVLSDGAGALVLEELEHAKARGAHIYAELIGFGMSADAYHMTSPPDDGAGAARCIRNALKDSQLNVDQVHYINAHGTSTPAGDKAEAAAIRSVFGDHAYELSVSSTKSMVGHLLGAAGAVEAIFSVLAIRDQVAPPTINLHEPDEGCDLDFVPHEAKPRPIEVAVSNSFGFGGTNGSLVFRRFAE